MSSWPVSTVAHDRCGVIADRESGRCGGVDAVRPPMRQGLSWLGHLSKLAEVPTVRVTTMNVAPSMLLEPSAYWQ